MKFVRMCFFQDFEIDVLFFKIVRQPSSVENQILNYKGQPINRAVLTESLPWG